MLVRIFVTRPEASTALSNESYSAGTFVHSYQWNGDQLVPSFYFIKKTTKKNA
jgi:hypothetical protein